MIGAEQISRLALPTSPLAAKTDATINSAPSRLLEMSKEFEATFVSMLLKEMRQTLEPEGGLFPGDSGDVQGGLFDMFLGRHIAESGGVGMAAQIVQQMQHSAPAPATRAKPESSNDLIPRQPAPGISATSGG